MNLLSSSSSVSRRPARRRSLKRKLSMASFALVASSASDIVAAFAGTTRSSSSSPSITTSSVFYTLDENFMSHHAPHGFYNPLLVKRQAAPQRVEAEQHVVSIPPQRRGSSTSMSDRMPTWLRLSKAHLVHENMKLLREAMLQSYFTENEVLKLTFAIQEASNGNANKMAGAAEFCLIMVETMEMGLQALIAGAFHYCSCVDARELSVQQQERRLVTREDALSPWEFRSHQSIASFGEHALQIERDAARLKRLEVVASMVNDSSNRVTPDSNAANNLRNLYTTEAKDWRALAIRGAACLYRLRGIIKTMSPGHRLTRESNRVCREALHIYAPLASRLGMHRLKNELEHASFQILYKRQHRTVESLLHQTRETQSVRSARRQHHQMDGMNGKPDIGESMQHILTQVQAEITEILKNDSVFSASVKDFSVTARVKESYSTWKKMLRNGFDHILQVPDALALRIVLDAKKEFEEESDAVTRARERALCYYVQQACISVWAPHAENPRFKDYIANPKENGYQSLHYTASAPWNGEDWTMEIQVRSGEMHKVAEFGVASHWNYKAAAKPPKKKGRDTFASAALNTDYDEHDDGTITISEQFGKVMASHNTDAYLRSLQQWHWYQHGSPVNQEPLVIFDHSATVVDVEEPLSLFEEAETRERAERIRARTERIAPYIEALTNEQSDLQRKNVFVFLSSQSSPERDSAELMAEGTVVALPAGASIVDVLRKCELPEDEMIVKFITHNGSPASLTSRLQNGDVLSIPDLTGCVTFSA
ncbi:GTP pyrophosphokinase [Nitzschia inconspicua]|uniref:GTP pyrophosphokinase n=1 Tax=Nitzschia inconspicua TaxID=303405 RepID=A0A9K3Q045_9STRA|nr:GTP pyrophosphokinase [Nitzschia inconspicua]